MYQRAIKHTIWLHSRQNVHKQYQHLLLKEPLKFTQIGIFGCKIYHLTTMLVVMSRATRWVFENFAQKHWWRGLVVSSPPAMEETEAVGREIESRQGIGR
jgi:hypothetical protein